LVPKKKKGLVTRLGKGFGSAVQTVHDEMRKKRRKCFMRAHFRRRITFSCDGGIDSSLILILPSDGACRTPRYPDFSFVLQNKAIREITSSKPLGKVVKQVCTASFILRIIAFFCYSLPVINTTGKIWYFSSKPPFLIPHAQSPIPYQPSFAPLNSTGPYARPTFRRF